MDHYTRTVKEWLDNRFRKADQDGIYFAHQPIYGFRKGHCDSHTVIRYIRTHNIITALSHLNLASFLDIGAGEGFHAHLVQKLFQAKVKACDLSEEACARAQELFSLDAAWVDIHALSFKENEFDIVLCSETLEHVSDIEKAVTELLRVAAKAVIITVPHESRKKIERNIRENIPHAHIRTFDTRSFAYLAKQGYLIISNTMICTCLEFFYFIAEAMPKAVNRHKLLTGVYNLCIPLLQRIFNPRAVDCLIRLDSFFCKLFRCYSGVVFLIVKDAKAYTKNQLFSFTPSDSMKSAVGFLYLKSGKPDR